MERPRDVAEPLRRLLDAPVPERGVSSRFLSIVLLCIELALGRHATYAVLRSHQPSVAKYGARLEARVDAVLDKHPHPGSCCAGSDCSNAPEAGGTSREEARDFVRALRSAAAQYPWPPRTRPTMLAVLKVHLDQAERLGLLEYDLDRRTMASAAGLSRTTVDKRMGDLVRLGWFIVVDDGAVSTQAWTYRLVGAPAGPHHPHPALATQLTATQRCGPSSDTRDAADIWRNGGRYSRGLGKARRETWLALQDGTSTVEHLAKVTGRTERTVWQHLTRFNALGMAEPRGEDARHGEWRVAPVIDWDALERYLGVAGYGAKQKRQFDAERKAHQRYVNAGGGSWSSRPRGGRSRG